MYSIENDINKIPIFHADSRKPSKEFLEQEEKRIKGIKKLRNKIEKLRHQLLATLEELEKECYLDEEEKLVILRQKDLNNMLSDAANNGYARSTENRKKLDAMNRDHDRFMNWYHSLDHRTLAEKQRDEEEMDQ